MRRLMKWCKRLAQAVCLLFAALVTLGLYLQSTPEGKARLEADRIKARLGLFLVLSGYALAA